MRTYSKLACFIFYCLAVFMLWTTAGIVSAATITGYGAKCLDIRSGEIRDGADVQIYTCHGGPNQSWTLTEAGEIRGYGDKCLDVRGGDTRDGTPVQVYACHNGPNQKWKFSDRSEILGLGGKCLDIRGGTSADGSPVQIYACHGGPNQKWTLVIDKAVPKEANKYQQTGLPDSRLEFGSLEEGFPPAPKGFAASRPVPWKDIPSALTDERAQDVLTAALADPRVRGALGERFMHIGTGELATPKGQTRNPTAPLLTRITFYSYTNNVGVAVEMKDKTVSSINTLEKGYQPPETAEEVKLAASLARKDSRIAAQVVNLKEKGILTEGEPGQPGYGNRLLYLTFSQTSGRLAYSAVVDLTSQKILAAGPVREGGE